MAWPQLHGWETQLPGLQFPVSGPGDDVFMLGGSWKTSMDDGRGLNTMTLTGPGQVRSPTRYLYSLLLAIKSISSFDLLCTEVSCATLMPSTQLTAPQASGFSRQ